MAEQFQVEFLGAVPIDPSFVMMIEGGGDGDLVQGEVEALADSSSTAVKPLVERYASSALCPLFKTMTDRIIIKTGHNNGNLP